MVLIGLVDAILLQRLDEYPPDHRDPRRSSRHGTHADREASIVDAGALFTSTRWSPFSWHSLKGYVGLALLRLMMIVRSWGVVSQPWDGKYTSGDPQ
jgi:hypothetical protein